jgi:hypothetical protein
MTQKRHKIAALVAAATFGVAYDRLIGKLENDIHFDQDTAVSLEVAVGVGATIAIASATGYVSPAQARRVLICFVASGLPMMIGSWLRDRARKAAYHGRKNQDR